MPLASFYVNKPKRVFLPPARRLEKRINGGQDTFNVLIEVQDHAVELARAHTERVVPERFAELAAPIAL